ncbi:hypothetical protein [Mannheimia haemolytica]|uniref:hypothetical protein n=1 Tax=Mannheimia haemolytica TaxID=75985 RepID=UPI0015BAAFF2|nr:hypothetical protein [Mannheimia haemolytica]HDL5230772.1 hypothetical protein [Mannheimia haemolytica]HDV7248273.1 hypothetical protein [Mannheimia haemolytica]HDZ6792306.1 hypothetical protein [Mannheimia haemolytica]HEB5619013.1 hypothetical protein [Mannheimia haemolytica]
MDLLQGEKYQWKVIKQEISLLSKQASKQSVAQFKQAPLPFTGQKRMFLKHF